MKNSKIFFQFFLLIIFAIHNVNSQFDLQDYGIIITNSHKSKFHWGTYKPNLFFAMKNRKNNSDVFGIMWYSHNSNDDNDLAKKLRHNCKVADDINYYWNQHNGVDYGSQIIEDNLNKINLNTKFIKNDYTSLNNQTWTGYIKGESNSWQNKTISLILYSSMENFDITDKSYFEVSNNFTEFFNSNNGNADSLSYSAMENNQQKYKIQISLGESTKLIDKSFQNYRKKYNETWRVKSFILEDLISFQENLKKSSGSTNNLLRMPNKRVNQPNILAIQYTFESDFEILVNFSTPSEGVPSMSVNSDNNLLKNFHELITKKEENFNKKFDEIYWSKINLPSKLNQDENLLKQMSQQALSNILGGVGYFWGAIKINLEEKLKEGNYHKGFRYAVEEKGLYTGTPSRKTFARGFLWDEGFHNIIISQWDIDMSIDILDSWFSTMSATGWMAREQVRGGESEAQVPENFLIQDKLVANPPTFIFPVEIILNYYKYFNEEKNLKYVNNFLKKCFDKLGAWYEWFEIYQKSSDRKSYQWYGRTSEHNLASGLDDYPRALDPNIFERSLDLGIWVHELLHSLRNLSELFDYELVSYFDKSAKRILSDINKLNLDTEKQIYNDYLGPQLKLQSLDKFKRPVPPFLWRYDGKCGNENLNIFDKPAECNPYSDSPCCSRSGWCGKSPQHCDCIGCTIYTKLEERGDNQFIPKEKIFSPHIGYVNLYPIAFGLINIETPVFRSTINFLSSSDELYSDYGIRSLSKSDSLYHSGEDYWRGNIWINMNYLVLRGLYKYYNSDENAFKLYKTLRENIIDTVFNQWKINKMFYEQYSDQNGSGLKSTPFNGWTSLILNIVTEKYD